MASAPYYSVGVYIRQTAASAAGTMIFAMRNDPNSTANVYIDSINFVLSFDSGTPLGRSTQVYNIIRFFSATPTGGSTPTVANLLTGQAVTNVTDVRFLDTGLTTTGVTTGAPFTKLAIPASDGATNSYERQDIPFVLVPGEGLCITLATAAVVGQSIAGEITWTER